MSPGAERGLGKSPPLSAHLVDRVTEAQAAGAVLTGARGQQRGGTAGQAVAPVCGCAVLSGPLGMAGAREAREGLRGQAFVTLFPVRPECWPC